MVYIKYFAFATLLFLYACSSSSVNSRYNKPQEEEIEQDKTPRFTSANDEKTYKSEFDEEPVEDHPVNVKEFVAENDTSSLIISGLTDREKVMMEIVRYLNTPYRYGGNNSNGIDCSAFTQIVFQNSLNVSLPRTASEQFHNGQSIPSKYQLKFGDLIFFNTTKRNYPGHVGIFLGNDLFAHASYSRGVTVSSLQSTYYTSKYVGAIRATEIDE